MANKMACDTISAPTSTRQYNSCLFIYPLFCNPNINLTDIYFHTELAANICCILGFIATNYTCSKKLNINRWARFCLKYVTMFFPPHKHMFVYSLFNLCTVIKHLFDDPVMKGRKCYSLKKDLQTFITGTLC